MSGMNGLIQNKALILMGLYHGITTWETKISLTHTLYIQEWKYSWTALFHFLSIDIFIIMDTSKLVRAATIMYWGLVFFFISQIFEYLQYFTYSLIKNQKVRCDWNHKNKILLHEIQIISQIFKLHIMYSVSVKTFPIFWFLLLEPDRKNSNEYQTELYTCIYFNLVKLHIHKDNPCLGEGILRPTPRKKSEFQDHAHVLCK